MQSYLQAVEGECARRFQVSFLQIAGDLYGQKGTIPTIKRNLADGVEPMDFVEIMKNSFALVDNDRDSSVYRAALVNFARESGHWELDGKGGIVFPHEDGILRIEATSGQRSMDFVVSIAEGEELALEGPGPLVPEHATFTEVARGVDIDVVLASFDQDFVPGLGGPRYA